MAGAGICVFKELLDAKQMEKRASSLMGWVTKKAKSASEPNNTHIMQDTLSCSRFSIENQNKNIIYNKQLDVFQPEPEKKNTVEENIDRFITAEIDTSDIATSNSSETEEQRKFSFLFPPKDKFGRDKGHPEYDRTTLYIPESSFQCMTNCEEQFWRIKMECYDAIVLFKKGKFYELFDSDAVLSAEVFGLKLTKRGSMRMTGIPEMALEEWTDRFIQKGYKVAIVDQKESGIAQNMRIKSGEIKKSVIERELKEIVTEITSSQEGLAICAITASSISEGKCTVSLCLFYPMESEFSTCTIEDTEELINTQSILKKENVREVICKKAISVSEKQIKIREDMWKQCVQKDLAQIRAELLPEKERYVITVLMSYLRYLNYSFTPRMQKTAEERKCMYIDGTTIETLSLVSTGTEKREIKETVLSQIDYTSTKMGRRLLRRWLVCPLYDVDAIERRYNTVEALKNILSRFTIIQLLRKVSDINDLVKKGKNKKISQEEIKRLIESLKITEKIYTALSEYAETSKDISNTGIPTIMEKLKKYNIGTEIVNGFNISEEITLLHTDRRLLEAKRKRDNVLQLIQAYAEKETKICKQVFTAKKIGKDYLLETQQVQKKKDLPDRFTLSGSTKNIARYSTAETRKYSEMYLEAEEQIFMLGQDCVMEISQRISDNEADLQALAHGLAQLDCFISIGEISGSRPKFADTLQITNFSNISRTHISNTLRIEKNSKLVVITGPNMGGKSTLLRNISVCIILRQVGILLPCDSFEGPLYDRVFTRIGAADNLVGGESTFQIEMKETANILSNASEHSFVIVDELGRGTSTREGCAISVAVKEYLRKINCTTFFSTHFFKSISSADRVIRMEYKSAAEENQEITYLYKANEGICNDSCGINVCRLAKIPISVIDRASQIKKNHQNLYSTRICPM